MSKPTKIHLRRRSSFTYHGNQGACRRSTLDAEVTDVKGDVTCALCLRSDQYRRTPDPTESEPMTEAKSGDVAHGPDFGDYRAPWGDWWKTAPPGEVPRMLVEHVVEHGDNFATIDNTPDGDLLRYALRMACNELRQLRRWKAEAIVVLGRWDLVHEALGSPARLGEDISTASRLEAQRAVARAARLREGIEGAIEFLDHGSEKSSPSDVARDRLQDLLAEVDEADRHVT